MSEPNSRDGGGRAVGITDAGSVVSDRPARQLTAIQKIGVAGLVAVVFISFIWIEQLNKKTQDVKQPDLPLTAGGAFRPVPQMAAAPGALPMPLPAPAASASQALFGPPQQHEMTPSESPIFAFSGGGGAGGVVDAALESAPSPASIVSATGLSHLSCSECCEQSGQERVVPSCSFELSLHGAF
jgi:hypothetical protein